MFNTVSHVDSAFRSYHFVFAWLVIFSMFYQENVVQAAAIGFSSGFVGVCGFGLFFGVCSASSQPSLERSLPALPAASEHFSQRYREISAAATRQGTELFKISS